MKTKERFFGILLGLALMLVLTAGMSAGAYAATPYPVWVGGVQVTSVNMTDVLGTKDAGATVRYTPAVADDPATTGVDESAPARLTLDGANITSTGSENSHNGAAIYADEDLIVYVAADSTVTGPNNKSDDSYGIFTYDKLNVTGPGTLTATGGEAKGVNGFSYGVSAAYVTVNGTLTATSSEAFCSYGVYAEFGDVTVTRGGELTATSDAAESDSCGVSAFENVTVAKGGVLTATGGTASDTDGDSCGVSAVSGDVTVSGELTAEGSTANRSNGVYAAETVTVSTTARLTAAGDTEAVSGSVKNAIVGTGWTDAAGTTGQAYLAVSTEGRSLNYRKLQFPAWPAPVYGTPDFTLPGSIATIEANAFEGAAMTVVYIPDTCTAIGAGAFKDCSKLTQIRIPEGCEIGEGAFEGCDAVYIYAPVGSPAQSFCADPANANCIFCEAAE